jgi:esterase/lipase superfamily enzyme
VIIIVSNRQINETAPDEQRFGEKPNRTSLDELRLAIASYNDTTDRWQVEVIPEPTVVDPDNPPSRVLFNRVVAEIDSGKLRRDWVFYIHGFNLSFKGNLEECRRIQAKYNVNVIAFSWPSNQGGFVRDEYRDARQAAKASSFAIDRTLEKLGGYLAERADRLQTEPDSPGCKLSLNLLSYSLGSYLLESYIRQPIFSTETRIFDNVIFVQSDVDSKTHVDWIDRVDSKRIYVTINERDYILKISDVINPSRLGNTAANLIALRPIYTDFTDAPRIVVTHNLLLDVQGNQVLDRFFQRLLSGGRGELVKGLVYNPRLNAFRIDED